MHQPIEVHPESMTQVLSPKQLARVIGASESSLKRWIDGGQIQAMRTTGGHRRVTLAEAVRFIRERHHQIVDSHPLGLPAIIQEKPESLTERLYQTLINGDAVGTRTLLMTAYVSGTPITELCDGPLRQGLIRIGTLSDHGQLDADIATEHLATDTCLNALNYLRSYLPETNELSPIALGGAPAGDPYLIPSLMAAMTFETCGFRARNLGANTPVAVLHEAAVRYRPRIVWLSVCSPDGLADLHQPLLHLADEVAQFGATLMIGGRVSHQLTLEPRANILRSTSLQHAASHARKLLRA
jgi:excisionase family DNA binding protein